MKIVLCFREAARKRKAVEEPRTEGASFACFDMDLLYAGFVNKLFRTVVKLRRRLSAPVHCRCCARAGRMFTGNAGNIDLCPSAFLMSFPTKKCMKSLRPRGACASSTASSNCLP